MDFYIGKDGQQLGPFTEEAAREGLARGTYLPTDLAWHEGMAEWTPLGKLYPDQVPAQTAAPAKAIEFFIGKNGERLGPFTANETREGLTRGAYLPTDLAWCEGMAAWSPLATLFPQPPAPDKASPAPEPPKPAAESLKVVVPEKRSAANPAAPAPIAEKKPDAQPASSLVPEKRSVAPPAAPTPVTQKKPATETAPASVPVAEKKPAAEPVKAKVEQPKLEQPKAEKPKAASESARSRGGGKKSKSRISPLMMGGGAVLALILLAGGLYGLKVWYTTTCTQTSQAFTDESLNAIITTWSRDELTKRISPEYRETLQDSDVDQLFAKLSHLGALKNYEGSDGRAYVWIGRHGLTVTARYLANATFEHGTDTFGLALVQENGEWKIAGFRATVPVFNH